MMALYARDTGGGVGQVVDLAILEPLISVLGAQASAYDQLGEIARRTGNRSTNNAPRNTYQTCDGKWVAVSTSATNVARRVMAGLTPGAIVLLHDADVMSPPGSSRRALHALGPIAEDLHRRGYAALTLDRLVGLAP